MTLASHPAFRGRREVVPLSGFSGAYVALLTDASGKPFVRKVAEEPSGTDKLAQQAKRQAHLASVLTDRVRIPPIEQDGEVEGCYWFDMAFIPGRDGVAFLRDVSYRDFEGFADSLTSLVEVLAGSPGSGSPIALGDAMATKFAEIDARTDGQHAADLSRLAHAARAIEVTLEPTLAHGDLTLENMIVGHDGQLWLIDAIESPFDHYWVDLSKLFQDCEGRWFRHRGRTLSVGVVWELRQRLLSAACAMDARYRAYHSLLIAMTFARILPYTRTATDLAFVRERVTLFTDASERELEKSR